MVPNTSNPALSVGIGFSRYYFLIAAAFTAAGGGLFAFGSRPALTPFDAAVSTIYALVSLGSLWAAWRSPRPDFPRDRAMLLVSIACMVLVAVGAVAWRDGVRSPTLPIGALMACLLGVVSDRRHGVLLGGLSAAIIAALAALEATGILPPPPDAQPLASVAARQLAVAACGVVAGVMIARIVQHSLAVAAERELRFRGLLDMAAHWYWEQDTEYRYTLISEDPSGTQRSRPSAASPLGLRLWELPDIGMTPAQIDAHRADLDARRPFRGLVIRRPGRRGRVHTFSVSGAPRFDADGRFIGYWGMSREISAEIAAKEAATASEGRYRELFEHSPTPLMLHRRGVVIDANEAAARLIGVIDPVALRGFDLLTLYATGETRERARQRMLAVERMPIGQSLPVADFDIESVDGRRLQVQATGVRVQTPSGPSTLSIFIDMTARQATDRALRRSETMLSALFATSPDGIALTEAQTGRYLLVNDAFCRMFGHERSAVIGRTAHEIGIWNRPADRDRLLAALRENRSIEEMAFTFRHSSGRPVSMRVSAALADLDGRTHLVLTARDMTMVDRVRLENEAMLRNASIGIAFTRGGQFVRANPHFERLVGWEDVGLAGQSGAVVWPDAAAHAEVGRTIGPALAAGETVEIERTVRRRDGTTFLARVLAQAVDPTEPARGGTIWIAEDITERRQIEQALASARDAAEAASRAKSAFLANTSHEIRTPLNGLLGLARIARRPDLAPAMRDQYLVQIHESAKRLSSIITDILDLSKIEAGKIMLETRPFDLRQMLASLHRESLPAAEAKPLALHLIVDDTLPQHVLGDELRLRQVISNFVSNAIKFTEAGQVAIQALRQRDRVRIVVADSGPGIEPATQARLFRPFTQADESTTRRYGGTGLGLSICRELATLMGGEVGLESQPGQGSRFWVEVPLREADGAPEWGTWSDTTDVDPELLRGARVLLVEDNPVNMMVGVAMLEQWGLQVEQATDGAAAVDAVERAAASGRPFDIVLMDVQMPGMSGHEAARRMRQRWSHSVLPIIALTAAALVSERDEALAAGMDDFLTKPIDGAKLREALMRQLIAAAS